MVNQRGQQQQTKVCLKSFKNRWKMRLILSTKILLSSVFFFQQLTACFSSKGTSQAALQGLARRLSWGWPRILLSGSEPSTASPFPRRTQSQSQGIPLTVAQMEMSSGTICVTVPKASGQPALITTEPVLPAAATWRGR